MAKIVKLQPAINRSKIANPFSKTSRVTNPFKCQDFEGNTIDPMICADVLIKNTEKSNKLKLIMSSVAGSMTKIRTGLTEPIVNFVNRVKSSASNAWEYAKNTNLSDVPGFRTVSHIMNTDVVELGKGALDSISNLGHGLKGKINMYTDNIAGIGKGLSEHWNNMIEKLHVSSIPKNKSVAEYRAMWEKEIALAEKKEVA